MNGAALQRFAITLLVFGGILELSDPGIVENGLLIALIGLIIGIMGFAREMGVE